MENIYLFKFSLCNDVEYIWIKHKCLPCVLGKKNINEWKTIEKVSKKNWQKKGKCYQFARCVNCEFIFNFTFAGASYIATVPIFHFQHTSRQIYFYIISFYLNKHFHKFMSSRNGKIVFYTTIMYAIVKHFLLILLWEQKQQQFVVKKDVGNSTHTHIE